MQIKFMDLQSTVERLATTRRTLFLYILFALILTWPAILIFRMVMEKNFSIDEFTYAHAGWLIADGSLPFRDFFSHHFPLSYYVFSLPFFASGSDPTAIIYARLLMLPFLVMIASAVWFINRGLPPFWRFFSILLVISSPNFVFFATEIRPDTLALASFLLAVTLCSLESRSRFSMGFLTGFLLVLTVWFSEKAVVYSMFFVIVLIYEWIQGRKKDIGGYHISNLFGVLAGSGCTILIIAIYMISTRSLIPWIKFSLAYSIHHLGSSDGFSWLVYFRQSLISDGWKIPFALVGILLVIIPGLQKFEVGRDTLNKILAFSLLGSWLSYIIQTEPYPYSLLPFYVLVAIFAARGMAGFWRMAGKLRPRFRVVLRTLPCLLPTVFGICMNIGEVEARLGRNNNYQMKVLERLKTMTSATDPIYDNSGSFIARPHSNYIYFTNAFIRRSYSEVLAKEIPISIERTGTTVFIRDCRFNSLPLSLKSYLIGHFIPLDGNLWVWGRRFVPDRGGIAEGAFRVTRPGWFFVEPEEVVKEGRLHLDGRPIVDSLIHLQTGDHAVWYSGSSPEFFISWLPRDGRRFKISEIREEEFAPLF